MRQETPPREKSPRAKPSALLALPAELLVTILQSCLSFKDAANIARTCKQLNEVWKQHHTPIYNRIALTTTPCYPELRQLLDDVGELPADAQVLSPKNIARILEISKVGDNLVADYEAMVETQPYHDPQVSRTLSPTEKPRFIRAQYQILGLLKLQAAGGHLTRIKSLDLKTLFLLSDFLCVFSTQPIDDPALRGIANADAIAPMRLQQELRRERNHKFRKLYTHGYHPRSVTPYEQGGRFAWWCDRQQETFQEMVTGRVYQGEDSESKVRDDIWYDSAEED
ncbi:hypothetical protein BJX63DRAFT_430248 [Aspergillus granulosus]|uniref:F-box domain-containing protein n=1 Tax=Aspergillus granulosus TaxID=176169 RepID=A0ABR4HMJ4_9EURO